MQFNQPDWHGVPESQWNGHVDWRCNRPLIRTKRLSPRMASVLIDLGYVVKHEWYGIAVLAWKNAATYRAQLVCKFPTRVVVIGATSSVTLQAVLSWMAKHLSIVCPAFKKILLTKSPQSA